MIWWVAQPSRARSERLAIAELEDCSSWLSEIVWRITEQAQLCADFVINHLDQTIPLTLTYPSFFPDMPPRITPREKVRLSGHQYGPGGELCLEYRPDNWEPSFTGAMMIQSAQSLLSGEQPSQNEAGEVANAHRTTMGQDARSATWRLILPAEARAALLALELNCVADAEFAEHLSAKHWLAFLRRVGSGDEIYWDANASMPIFSARKGYFVRVSSDIGKHIKADYEFVETLTKSFGIDDAATRVASSKEELPLLIECDGTFRLISLAPGEGKRSVWNYRTVATPVQSGRLPPDYDRLTGASVAIVGCGSIGSKIAASLARSGVNTFLLVDGDVLLPDNLVRNDLDWRSVGLNKPDGIEERIHAIRPAAQVTSRRIELGGQESSAATDAALVAIGKCHLIVDATADPQVFNLCGSIARNEKRILVWGEVFGGGIGGLVARLRPDHDPVPHSARRQILAWCAERGQEPPEGVAPQYGLALAENAPPLIADDADVTVIASHMARLSLDALLRSETLFPQSAYAVGLKAGWIFDAPFDTWPIALRPEGEWGVQKEEGLEEQLEAFVAEFFPRAEQATET